MSALPPVCPAFLSASSDTAAGSLSVQPRAPARSGPPLRLVPLPAPRPTPPAVDDCVDRAVERLGAQGINGRCPVDDERIVELPSQRPCVLRGGGSRTALP